MSMNMAGEHCPNCGDDLEEGQIGLCEDCSGDRAETHVKAHVKAQISKATHGSPELDADARKLEGMGQDAGPTIGQLFANAHRVADVAAYAVGCIEICTKQLQANQDAWEGEEDSVKEEHAELIAANASLLALLAKVQTSVDAIHAAMEGTSHVE